MPNDLRDQTRRSMPENVIALWDKVESFAEVDIRVENYPAYLRPDGRSQPASIMAGHDGAVIYLPTDEPLTAQAIFHELLHAHRLWVEGVPELVILTEDENNWRIVGELEADLEHLVIIPRQIAAGMDETKRLRAGAKKTWTEYPWPETTNSWRRRYTCLIHWLSHHLFADEEIAARMRECIIAEGHFREAELFRKKALSLLGRKEDLLACAVRFLKFPPNEVGVRYVDIRRRTVRIVAIRQHS